MKHPLVIFALMISPIAITFSLAAQHSLSYPPKATPSVQDLTCPNDDEETCWVAPDWRD